MSDTPRTDKAMKFCFGDDREFVRVEDAQKLERELNEALERNKRFEDALEQITKDVPAHDGYGGLFWPIFDGDGNEIGVQPVDPLMVIGSMHARALDAICGEGAKEPRL